MEVKDKIRQDQIKLQILLKQILEGKNIQEAQQKKAKTQFVSSLILGVFGAVGGAVTFNGASVMYGISTVANVISAISSGTNYIMSKEIVKQLNILMEKAIELNNEIQDEIDKLIDTLNSRIQEQPKFDLNDSYSSISTNLSNK